MKLQKIILLILSVLVLDNTYGQNLTNPVSISSNFKAYSTNNTYSQLSNSNCDTIFSFKARTSPTGLTWAGQYLWYVDNDYIYKVNTAGVHLDSIVNFGKDYTIGTMNGGDITFDGVNLWFVCEQVGMLFKINPTTKTALKTYHLPSFGQPEPNGWGIAWDGTNIWHSQYDPPRLYKMNPSNGNIIDSLIIPQGVLAIKWHNNNLYATTNNSQLHTINVNTGEIINTKDWCVPFSLGFYLDNSSYWGVSGVSYPGVYETGGKCKIYKLNFNSVVSVDEQVSNPIQVYPSPTSNNVFVKGKDIKFIEVYNALGEKNYTLSNFDYQEGEAKEIPLLNASKGIYFIRIQDGGTIITQKIVKE